MFSTLLKHAWLRIRRSPTWTQNVVQTIFLGFFGLYLILTAIGIGLMAGGLISDSFKGMDQRITAGALFIYYCVGDVLVRYMLQKYPSLEIKPYLGLPIKRATLAKYLLIRSFASFFNLLPIFFLVPFVLRELMLAYNTAETISFVLMSIGFIAVNNLLVFGLIKGFSVRKIWSGMILVALLILIFLEYQGYLSLLSVFFTVSNLLLSNVYLSLIPLIIAGFLYGILFQYFKSQLSIEDMSVGERQYGQYVQVGWFNRFGAPGRLMDLELKLIFRSKRARQYVIFSCIFVLVYPLLFISGKNPGTVELLFISVLMTGILAMNHGQLMLSWNSLHFDLLMTRQVTIREIFMAKYYLLVLGCILTFLLSLFYLFIFPELVVFNIAMVLFNMSFSIFAYMRLASINSLRVDPNEGGTFSFSGFGAAHYLIIFPLLAIPGLLYWAGAATAGRPAGLFVVGVIGSLGLVFHERIIDWCVTIFMKNRYKIMEAFRKTQ